MTKRSGYQGYINIIYTIVLCARYIYDRTGTSKYDSYDVIRIAASSESGQSVRSVELKFKISLRILKPMKKGPAPGPNYPALEAYAARNA